MFNAEQEITIEDFFQLAAEGGTYEIDTPQGWKPLKDLVKKHKEDCFRIELSNGVYLEASNDHLIKASKTNDITTLCWMPIEDVELEYFVETQSGLFDVIDKEYIGANDTFDFEVDSNEHSYYSNTIASHNTGKTMLCKVLAKEINCTVIYAMPSQLERTSDVRRICEMAKDLAPSMLIIEDIDFIAENRDESHNAGMVMELMNYMDGLQEFAEIVTLATTNAEDKIEEAVKNRPGRFDRVVQIPKPTAPLRERMLKLFTANFNVGDLDFEVIVKQTGKLSGAHLKHICETAAFKAIRSKSVDENKKAVVKIEHFTEALKEINNEEFSSFHKARNQQKKITGFASDDDW